MNKICFATNNQNKLNEIRVLLDTLEIVSLSDIQCDDELPENQSTLEGNAEEKAQYIWEHYHIPCFADDTGLEVAALGGEPGVYSARYAGPERNNEANIDLVLDKLKDKSDRSAQFRTVICLITGQEKLFFEGKVEGMIREERVGNEGFGYDPVFEPKGYSCTFAEMDIKEKSKISHRGKAVEKLITHLNTI